MNGWLVFILVIIVGHYALDTLMSLLNLRALSPNPPAEFSDTFDAARYRESQRYTRSRTRLFLAESGITTFATLCFLLLGGFNGVDLVVRSQGFGPIGTGLLFVGSLILLSSLLHLPFNIYSTFILEARFGFNRTTLSTYIGDIVKTVSLTVLLGTPVLAFVLWFFELLGPSAWIFCWLGVVCVGFVVQFLAPVLIMPLFNTFTELEDGSLKEKILSYADRQRFRVGGIYTMDGSRRSAKLNAYFTGFGRFRKIVFFDTLLEKLGEGEILAVLAHETGHWKKRHIWKMMAGMVLQTGLMFLLLSLFLENEGLFAAFQVDTLSIYASLVFFAFVYSPLSTLVSILQNYRSRRYEFEADAFAARTTGRPDTLIRGLKKLSRENLANLTPHPLLVFVTYSHPPLLDRVVTLREMEKSNHMNIKACP